MEMIDRLILEISPGSQQQLERVYQDWISPGTKRSRDSGSISPAANINLGQSTAISVAAGIDTNWQAGHQIALSIAEAAPHRDQQPSLTKRLCLSDDNEHAYAESFALVGSGGCQLNSSAEPQQGVAALPHSPWHFSRQTSACVAPLLRGSARRVFSGQFHGSYLRRQSTSPCVHQRAVSPSSLLQPVTLSTSGPELYAAADTLEREARLLRALAEIRRRDSPAKFEHLMKNTQVELRRARLAAGATAEEVDRQELSEYQQLLDLSEWPSSQTVSKQIQAMRTDSEAARTTAAAATESLTAVLQRAKISVDSPQCFNDAQRAWTQLVETTEAKLNLQNIQRIGLEAELASENDACASTEEPDLETISTSDEEVVEEGAVILTSSDEESIDDADGLDQGLEDELAVNPAVLYFSELNSGTMPLTARQEQLYRKAFEGGCEQDVLAKHPVTHEEVTRRDFHKIRPGEWLSDEVINLYMKLLQQRDGRLRAAATQLELDENKQLPKCHFFSSFFFNKLFSDKGTYDYKAVQRWTRTPRLASAFQESRSILDCDKIFFPIHEPSHWCMAVADLKNQTLTYYDSMHGNNPLVLEQIAKYLMDEAADKKKTEFDTSDWPRFLPKTIPRQKNGIDCGVFAVKFADYESRGRDFTFSQADMNYFRKRMAAELMAMLAL